MDLPQILEWCGSIAGLVYVGLEIAGKRAMWPVGILMSILYVIIFAGENLWASFGLYIYYLIVSVLGWLRWSKDSGLVIRRCSKREALAYGLLLVVIWPCSAILLQFGDDPAPWWDSLVTVLNAVATLMLTKAILEQWLILILANTIAIVLYASQGLYPTSGLYLVYLAASIAGWLRWRRLSKAQ